MTFQSRGLKDSKEQSGITNRAQTLVENINLRSCFGSFCCLLHILLTST